MRATGRTMQQPRGTFLKRIGAAVRAQHWGAICIEFVIVVLGVMVGTMVANWNSDRPEANGLLELPKACDLELPASAFAGTAAALRAHPDLPGQLGWQLSLVNNFRATARAQRDADLRLIGLMRARM